MFLTFFYKATYLSFLTFPPTHGVHNVAELSTAVTKGTHICMTYDGSFYADALLESQDNLLKVIGKDLKKNALTDTGPYEFFSTLSGKKGAFVYDRHYLVPFQKSYFISQDDFFDEMFSIAMAKTFHCEDLDITVKKIRELGFYNKFMREKLIREEFKYAQLIINSEEGLTALPMEDFFGAFACLGFGYLISSLILITEIVWHKIFK